ncbi:MAG: hypothetical protein ACT4PS_14680 [Betaproteobacteria bacterium]
MSDRKDGVLRPLVERLRARYPRIRIVEARRTEWDDGFVQQIVRYRATLSELKRCGLVTEEMLKRRNAVSACGETSLGDGFHLSRCASDASSRSEWELDVSTESAPRGSDLPLHQAREVLERISARGNRAPRGEQEGRGRA